MKHNVWLGFFVSVATLLNACIPVSLDQSNDMPLPASNQALEPVTVKVTLDESQAVSQLIGPEGGILEATSADGSNFRLVIPEGSLIFPQTITMIPTSQMDGLPLNDGQITGVQLEPTGLWFSRPAMLIIMPAQEIPLAEQIFLGYAASGADVHLYPPERTAEITFNIQHFSGYGVAQGTPAASAALAQHIPTDRIAQIEQAIAQIVAHQRELESKGQSDPKFWDKLYAQLQLAFDDIVKPAIEAAKTSNDYDQIVEAIKLILSWHRFVSIVGDDGFYDELTFTQEAFPDLVVHAVEITAQDCKSNHNFNQVPILFSLERTIQLMRDGDQASGLQEIDECMRFELRFHSVITEGGFGDGYGYRYELRSTVPLDLGDEMVTGGKLLGTAPLEYVSVTWIGSKACSFVGGGDTTVMNVKDGINGIPLPFFIGKNEVTLTFDPGLPAEHVTMNCPNVSPFEWNTTAWKEYYDKMHVAEHVETSYRTTTSLLAGEVIAKWTYHNTTVGPSGQAVIEDTIIEIVHTPTP